MNNPLGVSPSKGKQGTTGGKEKSLLTSVGIEPTTSGLDLPLLCGLSYKVAQRKSGTILGQKIFSLPRVVPCFPLMISLRQFVKLEECNIVIENFFAVSVLTAGGTLTGQISIL